MLVYLVDRRNQKNFMMTSSDIAQFHLRVGRIICTFANLEVLFSISLRIHLINLVHEDKMLIPSAIYGSQSFRNSIDLIKRIQAAEDIPSDKKEDFDSFFNHMTAISTLRDLLCHHMFIMTPGSSGSWFSKDFPVAKNPRKFKTNYVSLDLLESAFNDLSFATDTIAEYNSNPQNSDFILEGIDTSPSEQWQYKPHSLKNQG